jgi:hypothetical protein
VSQDIVNRMVVCGTQHFHGNLGAAGGDPFVALRLYNSGSANYSDLNDAMGATGAYVLEVANRLRGWRN